jgi:hypothetical protein
VFEDLRVILLASMGVGLGERNQSSRDLIVEAAAGKLKTCPWSEELIISTRTAMAKVLDAAGHHSHELPGDRPQLVETRLIQGCLESA